MDKDPRIVSLRPKKLIGLHSTMSLVEDYTRELWTGFMERRNEVMNRVGTDYISMQVYPDDYDYMPSTLFEKWAVVEVEDYSFIPDGMETYNLDGGQYAVFVHNGGPPTFFNTYNRIFNQWLPASKYILDNREPFELLGEKYNSADIDSEEEIWIPVRVSF